MKWTTHGAGTKALRITVIPEVIISPAIAPRRQDAGKRVGMPTVGISIRIVYYKLIAANVIPFPGLTYQ
jgi:hypothetical protein